MAFKNDMTWMYTIHAALRRAWIRVTITACSAFLHEFGIPHRHPARASASLHLG